MLIVFARFHWFHMAYRFFSDSGSPGTFSRVNLSLSLYIYIYLFFVVVFIYICIYIYIYIFFFLLYIYIYIYAGCAYVLRNSLQPCPIEQGSNMFSVSIKSEK